MVTCCSNSACATTRFRVIGKKLSLLHKKWIIFCVWRKYIIACFTDLLLDAQLNITGRDVNQRFEYNKTALHIAAEKDLLEAAKWLINKGADLEAKDSWGATPLHFAASWDSVDVAHLLISRRAKVNAKRGDGQTPLHVAAYYNNLKVA